MSRAATALGPATLAAIVAAAAFVLFAWTACPTIAFGDGPELIAAAWALGAAHPPGYPLYTLLGWLVLQIPAGEPAWRMNLLSALFAALGCGVAAWLAARLARSLAGGVVAGAALAVAGAYWSAATIAEVYALHVLLVVLLLAAAAVIGDATDERTRTRAWLVASAALGLGLSHHPTIVLALPAAACLALWGAAGRRVSRSGTPRRERGAESALGAWLPVRPRWLVAGLALAAALPVFWYGTLLLRARLDPVSTWGRIETVSDLADHVRALAFRHLDLGWRELARAESWSVAGQAFLDSFHPLMLPLALVGVCAGWVPHSAVSWRGPVAILLLVVTTALFGLRYNTADVSVFYLPAFLGLALALGLGSGALTGSGGRIQRVAGALAGLCAVALTAWANAPSHDLRGITAAEDYASDILATVPPGGVLFIEAMDSFGVLYLGVVRGERPDVTIYDRNGTLFDDLVNDHAVPAAPGESNWDWRLRCERSFVVAELARPAPRTISFLGWPGYEMPGSLRIEPVGLLERVRPAGDPLEDTDALWRQYHDERVIEQVERTGDVVARGFAATYPLVRGERAMFLGRVEEAEREFQRAQSIAPRIASIFSYIGTIYGRHGDYPRAIEALRRAVEIRPSSYQAWNNLATAYELAGNTPAAREALLRSEEVAPGQSEVEQRLRRLTR